MTKRIVALVAVLTLVMTMFILPTTASAIYTAYSNCSNGNCRPPHRQSTPPIPAAATESPSMFAAVPGRNTP